MPNDERPKSSATYLGDGLYADVEGDMIRVSTEREDGWHQMYFGPEEMQSLILYAEKVWSK